MAKEIHMIDSSISERKDRLFDEDLNPHDFRFDEKVGGAAGSLFRAGLLNANERRACLKQLPAK